VQNVERVGLTEGYKSKFLVFHKLFLYGVEKCGRESGDRVIGSKSKIEIQRRNSFALQLTRWPDYPMMSARDFFQSLLVDVEVRMHVLHVFVIFERFHQADHLRRLLAFELDVGIRNHAHA